MKTNSLIKKNITRINVMTDPQMNLSLWKKKIEDLIKEYGQNTIMETDAGHCNVNLDILYEK